MPCLSWKPKEVYLKTSKQQHGTLWTPWYFNALSTWSQFRSRKRLPVEGVTSAKPRRAQEWTCTSQSSVALADLPNSDGYGKKTPTGTTDFSPFTKPGFSGYPVYLRPQIAQIAGQHKVSSQGHGTSQCFLFFCQLGTFVHFVRITYHFMLIFLFCQLGTLEHFFPTLKNHVDQWCDSMWVFCDTSLWFFSAARAISAARAALARPPRRIGVGFADESVRDLKGFGACSRQKKCQRCSINVYPNVMFWKK